jgi:branched chain amino acid efflux pump
MNNILISVIAMGLVTLLTRAFPFILFSKKHPPEIFLKGARLIPGAVMAVLVLTSLPLKLSISEKGVYIPWIAAAAVVVIHLKFKNALLSIFGGTAIYMTMLNFFG